MLASTLIVFPCCYPANLLHTQDGENFHEAVVGPGPLGVITEIMLDIQPRYMMQQYLYQDLSLTS